ncbi:LuxR C-terminal-related transcriptional regulator [Streptomyces sp. N35]|uniref:helix-turn-helix transcriptional regulator n=1 Tax=Streptomyces sp. N35 TaxID=2795730 RepID=UPI0018F3CF7F|nr:LuxR C-terminal-related transcriptional regulator [Streptomyces sp. N35]
MAEGDTHRHDVEELCDAGEKAYQAALQAGRISRSRVTDARCLVELGLLHPDPSDMEWLLPTSPGVVVARLLREFESELGEIRRRSGALAGAAERFAVPRAVNSSPSAALRVLEGMPRINLAIDEATAACAAELRAMQPSGIRSERELSGALPRALDLQERGVRTRSLYTHVARHGQGLQTYLEQLEGSVEVRTLDEVGERLLIFDRSVAFIPASPDRSVALELRHPALIDYLVGVFDRFWHRAVPLNEHVPSTSAVEGVSHREHAIAALLAEGYTDAVIAERLGINVRTCRHHIGRLSETLGCTTRTQLGVRIAQTGLHVPPA